MTTDQAIQELEWELVRDKMALSNQTVRAIKLGIEALKFYRETRPEEVSTFCPLLPGETEE